MRTILCALSLALLYLATGCASTPDETEAIGPPPGSPLAHLSVLVGDWTGEAHMVQVPEAMRSTMPMDASFAGENTTGWTLGGAFLKHEGWQEMGPGAVVEYVEYITWDEKSGRYHSYYFNEWGDVGENWVTRDKRGVYHMEATGTRNGVAMQGSGTWRMLDEDTMVWTWREPMGDEVLLMEGSNKRR